MRRWATAIAIGAALLVLYVLRLDDVAGLYVDDAYYIVLAKSLATGQGYALISSAATPILPAFPPGFALLLAPIVAVTREFPANMVALKAVSIASMLGVAALAYHYLVNYQAMARERAIAIAALTASLPAFVFLATSTVMAEGAFTLSMLASAVTIERAARDDASRMRNVTLAAVISTGSLLIRSAGIASVFAGALLLTQRHGWRVAAKFLGIWLLCCAPWVTYAWTHQPTPEQRTAHGGSIVYTYRELLLMRHGGDPTSGIINAADLVTRVAKNVVNVFGRDVGAVILPAAYRGPSESGQEAFQLSGESGMLSGSMGLGTPALVMSCSFSVFVLIGWFAVARRRCGAAELISMLTVAMVVLVPARTFRYVLPLAPFVLGYFLIGIESVIGFWRGARAGSAALRIVAACLVTLVMIEHGQYIAQKFTGPEPPWIEDGHEARGVTDWINANVTEGAGIVSTNPGLVYLMTGHPTVALVDPLHNWARWQSADLRYAVALHVASTPAPELGYQLRYRSPRLGFWVLDLIPQGTLTESAR